jgi:hypothetical protein
MPGPEDDFKRIRNSIISLRNARAVAGQIQDKIAEAVIENGVSGNLDSSELGSGGVYFTPTEKTFLGQVAKSSGITINASSLSDILSNKDSYGPAIDSYVAGLSRQEETLRRDAWAISPEASISDRYTMDVGEALKYKQLFSVPAGERPERTKYQVQFAENGQSLIIGDDGSVRKGGLFPELANKTTQVVNDTTTGHAYALVIDNDGNVTNRVDIGQVGFPEVDPERKFQLDILTRSSEAETALAGIELQRRGQILQALGDDWARQVQLGTVQVQEVQLNLDRINSAFENRRKEREVALKYAVSQSSLFKSASGETMTRLPFANQLAGILSSATGQAFTGEELSLPVGYVNPDQAARETLSGTSYNSAVPGLVQGIQQTRDAVDRIVGQPLGDMAVTTHLAEMALPPGLRG